MFVVPTYDAIVNREFFDNCSLRAGVATEIWGYYKTKPNQMDLTKLRTKKFNSNNAQLESERLIKYLTRKCAEINADACEMQVRLTQIASELSPGELATFDHYNSFSSLNDSSESVVFEEN